MPRRRSFSFAIASLAGGIRYAVVEAAEYTGTRITARMRPGAETRRYAVPGNVTGKNSWGSNTLIKQGAHLVVSWEDSWEELPADVQLAQRPAAGDESQAGQTASLFKEPSLSPHEKKIYAVLKADEAMPLDEIVERLEADDLNLLSKPCFEQLKPV